MRRSKYKKNESGKWNLIPSKTSNTSTPIPLSCWRSFV